MSDYTSSAMGVLLVPIFQAFQRKVWERSDLTETQQRMYAAEKLENFRWISKLVATYSSYELTEGDVVEEELSQWLREIGQFAEVAYASSPLELLLKNYDSMVQPGFPLEGYYALSPRPHLTSALPLISPSSASCLQARGCTTSSGVKLLKCLKGQVAKLPAAIFSRWIHEHDCHGLTCRTKQDRAEISCKCSRRRQQIIISICGTSSVQQAIHDLRAIRRPYPGASNTTATVHTGFWDLYQGMKAGLLDGIQAGLRVNPPEDIYQSKDSGASCVEPGCDHEEIVRELVVTGHSMGGSIAHLLCIDLLSSQADLRSPSLDSRTCCSSSPDTEEQITVRSDCKSHLQRLGLKNLQLITFGEPRTGNQGLVDHWVKLKRQHEDEHNIPIREWCIKAYNDGVHSLPPIKFGYRHFSQEPLYTVNGKVYRVPLDEREFALFRVAGSGPSNFSHHSSQATPDSEQCPSSTVAASAIAFYSPEHEEIPDPPIPLSPLGGHNYYNERDLEGGYLRRMEWLEKSGFDREGWEERYQAIIKGHLI